MDNENNKQVHFWQNVEPTGRMLRPAEVVSRIGLSRSQIYAMIAEHRFPPFLKLSERAAAMPEAWLNAFIRLRADDVSASDSKSVPIGDV